MPPVQTLIDTQHIVALLNKRDANHEKAVALAAIYRNRPLVVTQAVLLEIGNSLARQHKREAIGIIETLVDAPNVEVVALSQGLFESGFGLYRSRNDKGWGLVDCISFVVMRERGILAALTFDEHFVQAGFQALMRTAVD